MKNTLEKALSTGTKAMKYFVLLTLILSYSGIIYAEDDKPAEEQPVKTLEELKQRISKIHQDTQAPALSVVLVENGETKLMTTMGKTNLELDVDATDDTLFAIGSTSKMFVGLAVLQLVESGQLKLDDRLNDLAPEIAFENPWEVTNPVRLSHLLEHTTGWPDISLAEYAHDDPSPIALKEALQLFPETRKSRWIPGTRHAYCNVGTAVAAYIVEKKTGQAFEDYVQENFFKPLEMDTATYYQPEDHLKTRAVAYSNGKAEDYWHIIYRPAGSINASPKDMEKMLKLFINRGKVDDTAIVSEASLTRMETPSTTLGAEAGIQSGYGITNYTTGHKNMKTVFRGHNGAIIGGFAALNYAPSLNSGFVVLATGNWAAMQQTSDLIKDYLLRDHQTLVGGDHLLPAKYLAYNGYYRFANPRSEMLRINNDLFGVMKFSTSEKSFHREPLLGGWDGPSQDYSEGSETLINPWHGLPSVAIVQDPILGEALQADEGLFVKVSAISIWGSFILIGMALLASSISTLFAFVWVPVQFFKRKLSAIQVQLRLWPSLSGLSLIVFLILSSLAGMDLNSASTLSPMSFSAFLFSSIYPICAILGLIQVARLKSKAESKYRYSLAISICILHVLFTFFLMNYSMIGLRTWAM